MKYGDVTRRINHRRTNFAGIGHRLDGDLDDCRRCSFNNEEESSILKPKSCLEVAAARESSFSAEFSESNVYGRGREGGGGIRSGIPRQVDVGSRWYTIKSLL